MAQQTPAQREQVRQLQPGAVASWWQPGHPGWAIYPVDSEQFMSTGALENVNVTNEQIVAPLPMGCESSFPAFAADPKDGMLTQYGSYSCLVASAVTGLHQQKPVGEGCYNMSAAVPGNSGGSYGQMPTAGSYPPFSPGQGNMAPPQVAPGSAYGTRSLGTASGYNSDGQGSGAAYGSRSRSAGNAPPAPRSSGEPLQPTLRLHSHRSICVIMLSRICTPGSPCPHTIASPGFV